MPNYLKYSTSTQSQALKIGNYWIGTGEIKKGPTSVTDYWNGIAPPSGGYTLYGNKASGGPSIYVAANDSELIITTNMLSGQSFTSVTQSLSWFITQTDKVVFNREYEPIVTNGLVLNLDAGFAPSYPRTSTAWYDLSSNGNNGTLLNGPIYSSDNGGSITVDGVDDRISISSSSTLNFLGTLSYSIEVWGNLQSIQAGARMMVSREDSIGVGRDGYNILLSNMTSSTVSFSAERFASNVQNGASVSLSTSSVLNTWAHYVATYDGQFYRLFFNGALVATSSLITSNITNTTSTVSIGNRGASLGNFINMKMAVVRIYNRGLSSTEVLQNYKAMFPRFLGTNILTDGLRLITGWISLADLTTRTANSVLAPDGTMTATLFERVGTAPAGQADAHAQIRQFFPTVDLLPSTAYSISFWAKRISLTQVLNFDFSDNPSQIITLTDNWDFYFFTLTTRDSTITNNTSNSEFIDIGSTTTAAGSQIGEKYSIWKLHVSLI